MTRFQVVLLNLEVLAEISASPAGPPRNPSSSASTSPDQAAAPDRQLNKYFHKFMHNLVLLFRTDRPLLEEKGSFIIRLGTWYPYINCTLLFRSPMGHEK